ncbi:MAG TPA: phage tail protein [Kofleriaceae bacterium]
MPDACAADCPAGPPGPAGPEGPAGPQGPAGTGGGDTPAGSIIAFAGMTPPTGWMLCDGMAVSRTTHASLFAVIGTLHGGGDGTTTFNLPDYRGRFLRGQDQGAGRDPDAASRGAAATGGAVGDSVGSVQAPALAGHAHAVTDPGHNHGGSSGSPNNWAGRDIWTDGSVSGINAFVTSAAAFNVAVNPLHLHTHSIPSGTTGIAIQNTGGAETRPTNAAVRWIIKT